MEVKNSNQTEPMEEIQAELMKTREEILERVKVSESFEYFDETQWG